MHIQSENPKFVFTVYGDLRKRHKDLREKAQVANILRDIFRETEEVVY